MAVVDRFRQIGRALDTGAYRLPALEQHVSFRRGALPGDDDDVRRGAVVIACVLHWVHRHGREDRAVGLVHRAEQLRPVARDRADQVAGDHTTRLETRAGELEELDRSQVEGQRVGEVRIDHDRVPLLVVALEEASAVLDRYLQPRVAWQLEVAVGDVTDNGIELHGLQVELGEVTPHALLHRAGAETDEEDLARAGAVGERQLQEVGVVEPGPERVVQVHPALERAFKTQEPRLAVVDHR